MPRYKNQEIWNLCDTVLLFALPRLKAFKKMKRHGFCCHAAETEEQWEEILDKIIWAFEQHKKHDTGYGKFCLKKAKYSDWEDLPDGGKGRTTLRPAIWDEEGLKEHRRQLQEGMDLFGKWWLHLWD